MSKIKINLGNLNEPQKEAITSKSKRVLVLAGAGSGKTRVLTSRISYLLAHGVKEDAILAVTFTNKASNEMKERVVNLLEGNFEINQQNLWMGTFHSVCNRILREHYSKSRYEILDTSDQQKLIKNVLIDAALLDVKKSTINEVLKFISEAKNNKLDPEESKSIEDQFSLPNVSHIYKLYEEYKDSMNLLDFDDLIYKTVILLESNDALLHTLRNQFKHILVDEYQDTNKIQDDFLKLLLRDDGKNYLFVVGDDDQSIYGWRGAEVGNILKFDKIYDDHHVVKLEENYRSTQNILDASNALIANNKLRYGKTLFTNSDKGDLIELYESSSPDNEAENFASIINNYNDLGYKYSDIAILYRSNFISRALETKLSEAMIPYTIIGGVGFWSRMEIKDMLAFLSIINNPKNDIQTERTFTFLKGVGKKTIEKIKDYGRNNNKSLFDSIEETIHKGDIKGKSAKTLLNYHTIVSNEFDNISYPYKIITNIINNFKIFDFYQEKEGKEKGVEREENINEMVTFIRNFNFKSGSLDEFFEMVALQQELTTDKKENDTVKLMTMHSAKGLEFPVVLMAGIENGIFPSERSLSSPNILEEERRLMYVSMTRAMKNLHISFAPYRFGGQYTGASLFINEIPERFIKNSNYRMPSIKISSNIKKPKLEYPNTNPYLEGDSIDDERYGEGIIIASKQIGNEIFLTVDFDFAGKQMIKKNT